MAISNNGIKKYIFKCSSCTTTMSIETKLEDSKIHMAPPCPCGKSRMVWLGSNEYKYGMWD